MARRRFALSLFLVVVALLATAAAAQRSVLNVLLAVPDCVPFVQALQSYAPDAWMAVNRPDFAGTILCPNAAAIARKPLPADKEQAASTLRYHILPAEPLPSSPQNGQAFTTLLANAFVHASRRGPGVLVHLVGGDAPSPLAPLPLDNTATVMGLESARSASGGPGGNVALIDTVLTPPTAALPPPTASGPAASAALQSARVLVAAPPPLAARNESSDNSTMAAGLRVGAAGGPSLIPKKLKKKIVKVVKRLLP